MLSSDLSSSIGLKFDIQFRPQDTNFNKNSMPRIYPKSVSPDHEYWYVIVHTLQCNDHKDESLPGAIVFL